jgi:hypothetical protein
MAITLSLVLLAITPKQAVAASITVSPDSSKVDTLIYIGGTGFTPGITFRTYFAYNTTYETVISGTVATDGTISHFLTVPEVPGGTYTVRVATSLESASDVFAVEPDIQLNKTSALVGEQINIYGTGFRANRSVTIRFDGRTIEATSTNSRGSFSETFRVPEGDYGSHDVTADDKTYEATIKLSVKQSISITPRSGATGTTVTVSGTGFRDNQSITITFDGDRVDTRPSTIRTDDDGSFTASFDVPTCINRSPEVAASDGKYSGAAEFTILANISLAPKSGYIGDKLSVTGDGFRSNRLITLTFDGEAVTTTPMSIRSDETGCFDADIDVPPSTKGSHTVRADDGTEVAEVSFTTLSAISLNPTSGSINAEVTINGSGFGRDKVITIRFAEEHVRTSATDAKGSFSDQFIVPQSSSGNYSVIASDGVTTASAIFTVTTSIELRPQKGHVGTLITVTGTGFSGAVTIQYDDVVVATTTADANGTFYISFGAPVSIHGHHTVIVSDTINTIETTFTMESEPPPIPELLSPENGSRQNSRPSFNWGPVSDPSGVTYTLQIATDNSFSTLLLEKQGLTQSQYTLSQQEGLRPTDSETPYYWWVRAIDGASNESAWSTPRTFYVRFLPQWVIYVLIVAVSVLISVLISRKVWRKRA